MAYKKAPLGGRKPARKNFPKRKDTKTPSLATTRASAVQTRYEIFRRTFKANKENATQAAIAAGYSPHTAHVQGAQLLKRLNIQRRFEVQESDIVERSGLTLESTLEQLRRMVEFDPRVLYDDDGTLLPIHDLPDDAATVLSGIESDEIKINGVSIGSTKKVKYPEKKGAVDMALRYFGAYERDNTQRAGNLALQINLVGTPPARVERDDD